MRTVTGKILLRFTKEQIAGHDIKGRFIIANPANPSDLSLEQGYVEAVNPKQDFFKVGDLVLCHYIVFTDGRSKMVTSGSRRVLTHENGDEVYYAYDGTDGFNTSEVYARYDAEKESWRMAQGYVWLSEPPEGGGQVGTIIVPNTVKVEKLAPDSNRITRTVLGIDHATTLEYGILKGDTVSLPEDVYFEVKVKEKSYYMVDAKYIILKNTVV